MLARIILITDSIKWPEPIMVGQRKYCALQLERYLVARLMLAINIISKKALYLHAVAVIKKLRAVWSGNMYKYMCMLIRMEVLV